MPSHFTPVINTCIQCSREFRVSPSAAKQKFCSRACRSQFSQRDCTCMKCGKTFRVPASQAKTARYCSRACYQPDPRVKCERCGKLFRPIKGHANRFCSKECHYNPAYTNCATCGKEFRIKRVYVGRFKRQYCSPECRSARRVIQCEWCGKTVETFPSRTRRKYCSTECYWKAFPRTSSLETAVGAELDRLGLAYETQKRFRRFMVDFYLPDQAMVIEADGIYWHSRPNRIERDKRREAYLQSLGLTVVHITEAAIRIDVEGAVRDALRLTQRLL